MYGSKRTTTKYNYIPYDLHSLHSQSISVLVEGLPTAGPIGYITEWIVCDDRRRFGRRCSGDVEEGCVDDNGIGIYSLPRYCVEAVIIN